MYILKKITFIVVVAVFLASCSNYKYLSSDDVYAQKPTALNLQEDETDITSYNAYKAKNEGAYDIEKKAQKVHFNRIYFNIGESHPFAGFIPHGYGMNTTFFGNSPFPCNRQNGYFNYGHYPMTYYGYFYSPYAPFAGGGYYYNGFGHSGFYNPYFDSPYYYSGNYGGNYYGGNYFNSPFFNNPNYTINDQAKYYGNRSLFDASSNRVSPINSKTIVNTGTPFSSSGTMGTSRRAEGSGTYLSTGNSTISTTNSTTNAQFNKRMYSNSSYSGKTNYQPTTSLRKSGVLRRAGVSIHSGSRTNSRTVTVNRGTTRSTGRTTYTPSQTRSTTSFSRGSVNRGSSFSRGFSSSSPSSSSQGRR